MPKTLIGDPIIGTWIFSAILFTALVFSWQQRYAQNKIFPLVTTLELKGLAILTIIFSHVGYFLSTDTHFLFPLSSAAGIGVNLFLLLSGYGLATSALAKPFSVSKFFRRHLPKIYVPMWITITVFFVLDTWLLGINRSWSYIAQSIIGYFPTSNLFNDINSPLWYFTLIVFYYLLFPIIFSRQRPWFSAIVIFATTYVVTHIFGTALATNAHLYRVHLVAFPLGIVLAWTFFQPQVSIWVTRLQKADRLIRTAIMAILSFIIIFLALHGNIDTDWEQAISLSAVVALVLLFLTKRNEFRFLSVFGLFSYELYLLHWPIMYRYDFLYSWLPGWLATTLYLAFIFVIGWLLRQTVIKITSIRGGWKSSTNN